MSSLQISFGRHIAWTSNFPLGLSVVRAEGPFIYLDDGRRLTDFISGIAVSSLGHRHPEVVQAVKDQVDRYMHVMVYGEMIQAPQVELAALLAERLPPPLSVVYFTMSGTEANEGALKLAKKHTGRSRMVAFERSYHGDTHGSLSVTGRDVYRNPYRPLLPEVDILPFDDVEALDAIDDRTACVITEPIQGEGGINVPSETWARRLRDRCTDVGALLIFDEIQTGFGRTGTLFRFQGMGIVPDILTMAKAMGGGMPLGAFVSSPEIFGAFRDHPPLSHVTTFGGHPVSCAAALASLRVLIREQLPARAIEIGEIIRGRLRHELIREVRGEGALLGLELVNRGVTEFVVSRCLEEGILLGWTLHSNTLIRIAPPLNIDLDVLNDTLSTILRVLDEALEDRGESFGVSDIK